VRTLPTGFAAGLQAVEIAPIFLVELHWPTGTLYLWNGYTDFDWDGKTWVGLGDLGSISQFKESSDGAANGVRLELSGIPSAYIAHALANDSQGRPARIYFGILSPGGFTIDPYLIFDGFIDNSNITIGPETSVVSLSLEKELLDNRSDARRTTHEDQQIDYPGDLGREYTAGIANKNFTWGKATYFAAPPGGTDNGMDDYFQQNALN
jgi:hypothetical protein